MFLKNALSICFFIIFSISAQAANATSHRFFSFDAEVKHATVNQLIFNGTMNMEWSIIGHNFYEKATFKLISKEPISTALNKEEIRIISETLGEKIVDGFTFIIEPYASYPFPDGSLLENIGGEYLLAQAAKGLSALLSIHRKDGAIHVLNLIENKTVSAEFCTRLLMSPLVHNGVYRN